MQTEPSRWIGVIMAIVTALLGVLIAFGVNISDNQSNAVLALFVAVAAAIPLVQGEITRNNVYAPSSVQEIANTVGKDPSPPTDAQGDVVIPGPPAKP